MGNLVSLMAHVPRGGEIIAGAEHHIVLDEAAGHAVVVGASIRAAARPARTGRWISTRSRTRSATRRAHEPITGMVAIENTHSHSMDQPLPAAYTPPIAAIAHATACRSTSTARASSTRSCALGVTARELAGPADSSTFCLSKGLGCPVGRSSSGRGTSSAAPAAPASCSAAGCARSGILAAAGLIALRDGRDGMIERLAEDHANARRLAEVLAEMPGIVSAGGIAQPAPAASTRPASRRTSSCSGSSATAPRSSRRSGHGTS